MHTVFSEAIVDFFPLILMFETSANSTWFNTGLKDALSEFPSREASRFRTEVGPFP